MHGRTYSEKQGYLSQVPSWRQAFLMPAIAFIHQPRTAIPKLQSQIHARSCLWQSCGHFASRHPELKSLNPRKACWCFAFLVLAALWVQETYGAVSVSDSIFRSLLRAEGRS